jgi:hypothetical protein
MLAMIGPIKVSAVEYNILPFETFSIISDYDKEQFTVTCGIHPGNDTNIVDFPSSVNIPALFDVGCNSLYVVFGKKSSVLVFGFNNIGSSDARDRAEQWSQIIETAFDTTFTWQDTNTSSSYVGVRYTNAGASNVTIYRGLQCINWSAGIGGVTNIIHGRLAHFAEYTDYQVGIGARDEPSKGPKSYDIGLWVSWTKKMSTGTGDPTIDVLSLLGVTSLAPSSYAFNNDMGIYLSTVNLTINSSAPITFVSCEPSPLNPPGTRGWYSTPSTSKIDAQFKFMNDSSPVSPLTFTFILGEPIKQESIISCFVSSANPTVGDSVIVSGLITPPLSEKTVTISYKNGGSWATLATVTSLSNGSYSYSWTPSDVGSYQVKASWAGDDIYNGAESDTVSVIVKKMSSSVSCSTSHSTVINGDTITVTGSISPAVSGKTVTLAYTKPDGTTKVTRTVTTNSDGSFSDSYKPDTNGAWSVTASWEGDAAHEGTSSTSKSFTANPQPSFFETPTGMATIGGAVLAAIVLTAILILKRRKKTS